MELRQWWKGFVGDLDVRQTTAVLGAAGLSASIIGKATSKRRGVARGLLMAVVATDLVGGLVAFQLPPTREAYSQRSWSERMAFVGVHLQPLAVPIVEGGGVPRALARYIGAVGATTVLESLDQPGGDRRLTANAIGAALSVVDLATDRSSQRWMGPVYLMKVIGGHSSIPASRSPSKN